MNRKLAKIMKQKNSPQKKFQEEMATKELIKTDINSITEQEFKIIVIKLIAGLGKSIEDSRESIAAEVKELKNSHDELTNVINGMQNEMEETAAWIEEAKGKIGELEDKIMEKDEAEKKRDKKNSGS